jgi:hypothetical protein
MQTLWRCALVGVLSVGACKAKEEPASAPTSTSSGPVAGSGSAAMGSALMGSADLGSAATGSAAMGSAAIESAAGSTSTARPGHDLASAFGGTAPVLPQLSADGATAAASVLEDVDGKGKIRTSVALVTGKGAPELVELGKPAAAAEVKKRLTDGGYKPFESLVDLETANSPIKLGGAELHIDGDDAIAIRLVDDKGRELQKQTFAVAKQCSANPRPDYVWFDSARKRVLVEIGWELGPHDCNDAPAPQFLLWSTP